MLMQSLIALNPKFQKSIVALGYPVVTPIMYPQYVKQINDMANARIVNVRGALSCLWFINPVKVSRGYKCVYWDHTWQIEVISKKQITAIMRDQLTRTMNLKPTIPQVVYAQGDKLAVYTNIGTNAWGVNIDLETPYIVDKEIPVGIILFFAALVDTVTSGKNIRKNVDITEVESLINS